MRITACVTNDLTNDQRMQRICGSLADAGHNVTLVGRGLPQSKPLQPLPFHLHRLKLKFTKGKLFYLFFNLRLFCYLMGHKQDLILANDVDTLLACTLASKLKGKKLAYDAHEYFTEMEEVINRPFTRTVWGLIEKWGIKHASIRYTVSEGLADLFAQHYQAEFQVIRNLPVTTNASEVNAIENSLVYQGALNVGRGLESSVLALKKLPNWSLHIYGDGPIKKSLIELSEANGVGDRVLFHGKVLPSALKVSTPKHTLGLTLFSNIGQHHHYSLANRFFDYIQAGIPQITIDFPEYRNFMQEHEIGELVKEDSPEQITNAVIKLTQNQERMNQLKANCELGRNRYNWETESKILTGLYL